MCDLICDVITCCVQAAIRAKSTYMIKSWWKTRKKRTYGIKWNFYI